MSRVSKMSWSTVSKAADMPILEWDAETDVASKPHPTDTEMYVSSNVHFYHTGLV